MSQSLSKRTIAAFLVPGIVLVCLGKPAAAAESAYAAVQSRNLSEEYPKEIPARQAAEKKSNGAYILDVRELNEFIQNRIQGAMLIPFGQLRYRLNELPKDKDIVVVCRSGDRSLEAVDILRKASYHKSSSMTGGINAWKAAGYPTVSGR